MVGKQAGIKTKSKPSILHTSPKGNKKLIELKKRICYLLGFLTAS